MATITANKTIQTDLLALQVSSAASTVIVGSAYDMSTAIGGLVLVRFGRTAATAAGAGVNIRIEASNHASVNNSWFPIAQFTTNFATCELEAVSGTVGSGTKVITVASTANLAAGDIIFIYNSGTVANSCWARIKSIQGTPSITVEDDLVNAVTGCNIYDSAEIYNPIEVPQGVKRIRAVADGSLFTQVFAIQVSLITVDSMTSA